MSDSTVPPGEEAELAAREQQMIYQVDSEFVS